MKCMNSRCVSWTTIRLCEAELGGPLNCIGYWTICFLLLFCLVILLLSLWNTIKYYSDVNNVISGTSHAKKWQRINPNNCTVYWHRANIVLQHRCIYITTKMLWLYLNISSRPFNNSEAYMQVNDSLTTICMHIF